jgi:hypothetical protein
MLETGKIDNCLGIVDGYVTIALQPFELIEMAADGYKFPQELQDLLNESKDDDNPILCLFR